MNRKGLVVCALLLITFVASVGFLVWRASISPSRAPEKVTLTFVDVGFEYKIYNRAASGEDRHVKLSEGNLTVDKGISLIISLVGNNYYKCGALQIDYEQIISGTEVKFVANKSSVIKAIVVSTPYKIAVDKLSSSGFKTVRITDLHRYSGFSNTLCKIRVASIEGLMSVCNEKGITLVLYYRGRLFREGWCWDCWDYFWFIEGENVYYYKQGI